MILDRFDEILILTFGIWFMAQGCLFGMIWQTSRTSMIGRQRTRLSHAHHDLAAGLVIVSFGVSMRNVFRWIRGPADDAVFEPLLIGVTVQMITVIGLVITTWAGVRVVAALLERSRRGTSGMGISRERILATVVVDLPMIVSDQDGVIRYATGPMEALALAKPGELEGLNTTEIMPERYRAHHTAGVERFVKTGEGKLIGKVVNVDLLRRDGTETPISLAFTASTAEDHHWFIAIIWARESYDQPAVEVANVRQDAREARQNDQGAILEARRVLQDEREVRQNKRDADR